MAKLYVAYGSNLNKEQMKDRCPGAEFVGRIPSRRSCHYRTEGRIVCSGRYVDNQETG